MRSSPPDAIQRGELAIKLRAGELPDGVEQVSEDVAVLGPAGPNTVDERQEGGRGQDVDLQFLRGRQARFHADQLLGTIDGGQDLDQEVARHAPLARHGLQVQDRRQEGRAIAAQGQVESVSHGRSPRWGLGDLFG